MCSLLCASPTIAEIAQFSTVAVPDVPDPYIYPPSPQYDLLVASNTVPTGIDNNGDIVGQFQANLGFYTTPPYGTLGFVLSGGTYYTFFNGGYVDNMPCNTCGPDIFPTGFNDSGIVVGNYLADQFDDTYGFVAAGCCISNGVPLALPPVLGFFNSVVYPGTQTGFGSTFITGINDSGQIVGNYVQYDPNEILPPVSGGFLSDGTSFTPLPFSALAINNKGQILGQDGSGNILVDTRGSIQNLGLFPFTPTGFNDAGTIVGGDYLYTNGKFTAIQLPGVGGVQINGINDSATFVGTYASNGAEYGFVATTPEPGYRFLLFAGLCGMVAAGAYSSASRRPRSGRYASTHLVAVSQDNCRRVMSLVHEP